MNRSVIVIGALASSAASAADSLGTAFSDAEWLLDWRLRHEAVEQQGFANDADALTSRVRAGFETAPLGATRLLAEGVWVADLVDDYDSTTNGNTQYPVVADPGGYAALNRLAITNAALEHTTFTIGRQRIIHDDARFVGNVGWRQNEQTYDAVRVQYAGAALEAELAYAGRVNRIFGPDSPSGEWSGDIVMARVAYALGPGRLSGFHYGVDVDEAAAVSSRTTGLRYAGSAPAGGVELEFALAAARQTDAGANPAAYTETYLLAEAGIALERFSAGLGYERLGGNGSASVTTPLATLHAFQGWADRFLGTPAAGIVDTYADVGYALGPAGPFTQLSLTAAVHDFAADAGPADLGSEIDVALVARTGRLAFTLKYASYDADAPLPNTDKAWASLEYVW